MLNKMSLKEKANSIRRIQNINTFSVEQRKDIKNLTDRLFGCAESAPVSKKDKELKKEIDNIVTQIYNIYITPLKNKFDLNLKFEIGNDAKLGKEVYGEWLKDAYIKIDTNKLYKNLASKNKQKRIDACYNTVQAIYHEIQHQKQDLMISENVASDVIMKIATNETMCSVLYGNVYDYNYDNIYFENDAEEVAYRNIKLTKKKVLDSESNRIEAKLNKELGTYEIKYANALVNNKIEDFSISRQNRDNVVESVLDKVFEDKDIATEKLKQYPILQRKYNLDGTRKDVQKLIEEKEAEDIELRNNIYLEKNEREQAREDSNKLYYELIYEQLKKTEPLELKNINSRKLSKLLDEMKRSFKSTAVQMKLEAKKETNINVYLYNEEQTKKRLKRPKIINAICYTGDKIGDFIPIIREQKEMAKNFWYDLEEIKIQDIENKLEKRLLFIEGVEKGEILDFEPEQPSFEITNPYLYLCYKYFNSCALIGKKAVSMLNIFSSPVEKKDNDISKCSSKKERNKFLESLKVKNLEMYLDRYTDNSKNMCNDVTIDR